MTSNIYPAKPNVALLAPGVTVRNDGLINIDTAWEPAGVTDQFLAEADTYHERYFNNAYWTWLVDRALQGIDRRATHILDIGSGSGNTIVPLAEAFPTASIFASDISPQLLTILMSSAASRPDIALRLSAYCFDLHKNFFTSECFDGVLGGAVLHHMLDPIAALRNVATWVKPGGWITLVEPLERGALMMAIIYHTLLEELEDEAEPRLVDLLRALIQDVEARLGAPRLKANTPYLDDKWFFSPTFVRQMMKELGFSRWSLEPVGDGRFTDNVLGTLSVGGWNGTPPQKMLDVLAEFDNQLPAGSVRRRLQSDGIIRLWK